MMNKLNEKEETLSKFSGNTVNIDRENQNLKS